MDLEVNEPIAHDQLILDLKSWRSVLESVDSFLVILPTLLGFVLSRILCGHLSLTSTRRFLLEFLLVGLPSVILVTVGNSYSYSYSLVGSIAIIGYLFGNHYHPGKDFKYVVGKRPIVFTLLRATAYSGTCVAILAVDFPFYPHDYRKSQTFGASAMDMGIGLFVVNMGLVSQRPKALADLKKLPKSVVPLLVLGLARTLVITIIDYHQDDSEYGKHLNAFFILGFTKLLGSLYSLLVRSNSQLLGLALGLLVFHEVILQLGVSSFVMASDSREGFFTANREGLSSLHGCVALYLLSIYFAKWYTSQDQLNYHQLLTKFGKMFLMVTVCWSLVFTSAYITGIARVTFNFGYVTWLFAVAISLILIYAFIFELKFVNLTIKMQNSVGDGRNHKCSTHSLPTFVESLNMNGLTHFMLSNFLTGIVNMALNPGKRNGFESVLILSLYTLTCAGAVFIMLRKGIRLA
ncbi:hypothetical protein KR074_000729 [Drosophila pseudoananassae]|nr:hypothetical protein KR074_000729 [Drosophila pseudoananassae]